MEVATVYTIGHSTRSLDEMIAMLHAHGVTHLADVRTTPRSRTNPQFNKDTFPTSLQAAGISYTHMAGLGGLRKPMPDSINVGWKHTGFRGYADYMLTEEFGQQLDRLIAMAADQRVAIMCAEAVPWRCHRNLIGDALMVRGHTVLDILSKDKAYPHKMTRFAQVDGGRITYPEAEPKDEGQASQPTLFD